MTLEERWSVCTIESVLSVFKGWIIDSYWEKEQALGEELTNLRENDPRAFVNRIFRISITKNICPSNIIIHTIRELTCLKID